LSTCLTNPNPPCFSLPACHTRSRPAPHSSPVSAAISGNALLNNHVYLLDPRLFAWTAVGPAGVAQGITAASAPSGPSPTPRAAHAAAAAGFRLFVFGGLNLEMVFGELFVLDTMPTPPQWSQIPAAAGALWPPARALSRMESWQGALWLFGGTSTSDASAVLGDFFHFNLSTLTWSLVDGTTGPPPSPRAGHGSAVLGTVMYIFGGINLNLGESEYLCLGDLLLVSTLLC